MDGIQKCDIGHTGTARCESVGEQCFPFDVPIILAEDREFGFVVEVRDAVSSKSVFVLNRTVSATNSISQHQNPSALSPLPSRSASKLNVTDLCGRLAAMRDASHDVDFSGRRTLTTCW